ncbi:MAG: VWA domain-containing protein [Anaerolineales bacterium]|jgi:Ca-activated chloride channel family protein
MTFIWPAMLFSLVIIPLFVVIYLLMQRRRRQIAANYGSLGFAPGAKKHQPGLRRHIPAAFFLVGLTILAIALARPQAVVALPKQEGTVILAFDVSGSMAADDIKPTRMEAAKAAARDFVKRQPLFVQTGVVAFSDNGLSVQVPTNDPSAVLAAINRLAPQTGTSVGQGILASLNAIAVGSQGGLPAEVYSNLLLTPTPTPTPVPHGKYTPAVIILLSDGENNENPDPLAAAQTAADRGVRIYTVGIGSPTGTTVHINGFSLHTQLDEATLQQISQITGGTYYNAQNAQDLLKIYDHLDTQVVNKPEKTELTAFFAGAGIFFMLGGGIFSLLWFSRLP